MDHLCGAIIDPAETAAVCEALAAHGPVSFGDARPDLKGFGAGKCVLLQDAERELFGHNLPSWSQQRGTCVSQGTGRALQDALYFALSSVGGNIGKPVQLCFETIYGGSRVQVGKGKLGSGDGSIGAWAAQFVHDFGLLARGKYGSIDLSSAREDLAVQWGMPRAGVPQLLITASTAYKSRACMKCETVEDCRDASAAGYGLARCASKATSGTRDANGILRPKDSGGHCQELAGVFEDLRGNLMFVEQQSWGAQGPQGGGTWKLKDGREVIPREGACAIYADDVQGYLKTGEVWALAPPKNPWRDEDTNPSDLVA